MPKRNRILEIETANGGDEDDLPLPPPTGPRKPSKRRLDKPEEVAMPKWKRDCRDSEVETADNKGEKDLPLLLPTKREKPSERGLCEPEDIHCLHATVCKQTKPFLHHQAGGECLRDIHPTGAQVEKAAATRANQAARARVTEPFPCPKTSVCTALPVVSSGSSIEKPPFTGGGRGLGLPLTQSHIFALDDANRGI